MRGELREGLTYHSFPKYRHCLDGRGSDWIIIYKVLWDKSPRLEPWGVISVNVISCVFVCSDDGLLGLIIITIIIMIISVSVTVMAVSLFVLCYGTRISCSLIIIIHPPQNIFRQSLPTAKRNVWKRLKSPWLEVCWVFVWSPFPYLCLTCHCDTVALNKKLS